MISEVINAIFLTYIASEYLAADGGRKQPQSDAARVNVVVIGTGIVAVINILDRVSGAAHAVHAAMDGLYHAPRILFVAVAYVIALYFDVNRQVPVPFPKLLSKAGWAMCKVLPIYPFLAVLISLVFAFVISLWDALHLPMELLNAPIYYGTLYGPFAYVYLKVKRTLIEEHLSLPSW